MSQEPNTTELRASTEHKVSGADTKVGAASVLERAQDIATVVGLLAYAELAAQMRLAIDASRAPQARYRIVQADLSAAAHRRMRDLVSYLNEYGLDGEAQVAAFNNAFDDYEERTKAETWHERVLKGYVGHSVSVDFCRIIIRSLPQSVQDRVNESLSSANEANEAAQILTEATQNDSVLASRLALWGRRLVGEALNQIQQLVAQYPALERIVLNAAEHSGAALPDVGPDRSSKLVTSWIFSQITADHARRMDKIGLAS